MNTEEIQLEWNESQNEYSLSSRKIASHNTSYHYFKNHQRYTYTLGRYRYSINGNISVNNVEKELKKDGVESDNQAYYWHYFHNSCSFVNDFDFSDKPKMKTNRFMVKKIDKGEWNFNHNAYSCAVRILAELKTHIKTNQSLIAYLPVNKQIQKAGQDKYFVKFINLLKNERIAYVVGNLDKIKETSKQLVIFVIDLITSANRQNTIVQSIRNKRSSQFPLISYYSLLKIMDEENTIFCFELIKLRNKQSEEKKQKEREVFHTPPAYDEEALIMRALSGRGADPEIFGF